MAPRLWAFLVCCAQGFLLNEGTDSAYFFAPYFPEGHLPTNETGRAIHIPELFDEIWLQPGRADNFKGGIAVWSGEDAPGTFREDVALRAQELGFVGVIGWSTWRPDHFFEINLLHDRSEFHIPYVVMDKTQMAGFKDRISQAAGTARESNTTITILDDSPNEWTAVYKSLAFYVLYRCVLGIASCLLAVLAVQKLFLWWINYKETKMVSKIAVLCLLVELACNLERAGSFAMGGLGGTRQVPWTLARSAFTIGFPLTYLTTALTAAYIHEVLTAKSPMGTMVERTRKPLLCLTIFYLATDIPLSIVSSFRISGASLLLADVSALLVSIGLALTACLLLYIVIQLRRYQKKSVVKAQQGRAPDRLSILLDRVQTSTYCVFFTTLASIFTQTSLYHIPQGFVAINSFIFIGFMSVSLLHIIAYGRTPTGQKKKKEKEAARQEAATKRASQSQQGGLDDGQKSPRLGAKNQPQPPASPVSDDGEKLGSKLINTRAPRSSNASVEMSSPSSRNSGIPSPTYASSASSSPASSPAMIVTVSRANSNPSSTTTTTTTAESGQRPQFLRPSSFAATRKEIVASPRLLEERGPWQVIQDPHGRVYYNNTLTRMTTWTDHTEAVPPPYEALYGNGTEIPPNAEPVVPVQPAPVLLEERGEWMAIQAPTGHVYYHNKLTRMQTWTDPTAELNRRMVLDERGNWQEILDGGQVYYHHKLTRQKTWTAPKEMLEDTNPTMPDDDDDDDDEDEEQPHPLPS